MVSTYEEFHVVYFPNGKIKIKQKTERSTVRISEHTANVNNTYSRSTGLVYELVPDIEKEKTIKELKAYIIEKDYEIDLRLSKDGLISAIDEIES